jgi:hypothetical protein
MALRAEDPTLPSPKLTGSVPEGRCDRSLARSAWEASPKEPSRRVRYDRVLLMIELVIDVTYPLLNTWISSVFTSETFVIPILRSPNRSAHTCKNQTVPYGTALFGRRFPQALRARLRSHCSSGTKLFAHGKPIKLVFMRINPGLCSLAPSGHAV